MVKHISLYLLLGLLIWAGCRASVTNESPPPLNLQESADAGLPTGVAPSSPTPPAAVTGTQPPTDASQGNADVIHVRAVKEDAVNRWTFHVTVRHPDQGWEDYVDGWDVVTPSGEVLKSDPEDPFTRLLLHPHVDEQPFTRSQSGIEVPSGVTKLTVRAHDLVDGYGGMEVVVDLSKSQGEGFEVER